MIKQIRTILCLMLLLSGFVDAQIPSVQRIWVFFRNKDAKSLHLINPTDLGISERTLKRRSKTLRADQLIDELDLPVSKSAIIEVEQTGAKIRSISRWFNAVSAEATVEQVRTLNTLPGITSVQPVVVMKRSQPKPSLETTIVPLQKTVNLTVDYGPSATQLTNIRVVDLHSLNVRGTGVLIGMLDDGFNNYRIHPALRNIPVVADSDFIHNINDVDHQPWESSTQGNHGAGTLSAIGGFDNGKLIGAAYGASFILAKTEMDSSGSSYDFNSEEDTYVAALEWMERLGVDITSSSLGYKEFWGQPTYTTSDMNGRTTKVAKAAMIAARKGVIVVTAMGNEGGIISGLHVDSTLVSPADADSIISVGASYSSRVLASFSSCGPTSDGRIKPEVVAQGVNVYWAHGTDGYEQVSGTSCSTPLVAGAAALVLSAHPELTNMQVRQALINTAGQIDDGTIQTDFYPNNYYGNGFINAFEAALYYGPVFSNSPSVSMNNSHIVITTFLVSKSGINIDSLFFHYKIDKGTLNSVRLQSTINANEYKCILPTLSGGLVEGFFSMTDTTGISYQYPTNRLLQIILDIPQKYVLLQNYPNPFNNSTTLTFDSPSREEVEISVFNLLGQHIKTIFQGRAIQGMNIIQWNGKNENGNDIASGVYFARLKTSGMILVNKMLYLK